MGIRDKNMNWKPKSCEFSDIIRRLIEPVFDAYSKTFTYEEMFYLITHTADDIIIDKALNLKYNSSKTIKENNEEENLFGEDLLDDKSLYTNGFRF
jgi:hypothetical protein